VLLTIFVSLPGFLSAGRKQIAYQHSSLIYYLTRNWLLFHHWAVKKLEPPGVLCVCVDCTLKQAQFLGEESEQFRDLSVDGKNNIKILRLLFWNETPFSLVG